MRQSWLGLTEDSRPSDYGRPTFGQDSTPILSGVPRISLEIPDVYYRLTPTI